MHAMATSNKNKIESQMNNDSLRMLEKIFRDADKGGGGRLHLKEFEEAMKKAMEKERNDTELNKEEFEILFMKVDTDCDGTVDWEEFCTYMLLENQHKDTMLKDVSDVPFPYEARVLCKLRNDALAKITYFPLLSKTDEYNEELTSNHGQYVTCTKEGTLTLLGLDFHIHRTLNLVEKNNAGKIPLTPIWVTDMVCLPKSKKIAIATTDRDIFFYDTNSFNRQYAITALNHCILCMDYWQNPKNVDHSYLLFGDASGSVSCITFLQTTAELLDTNVSQSKTNKSNHSSVTYEELSAGRCPNVNVIVFKNLHDDWVRKVLYIQNLDCFISCSSSYQSVFLGDLFGKKMKSYFRVRKGVYSFDYNKENNLVVTGGLDKIIRLWNPYLPSRPTSVLKGHNASVSHVITNENQIISLSKDHVIMIWNVKEQFCLQTLPNRFLSNDFVTTMFYNKKLNVLLLGGSSLNVLERSPPSNDETSKPSDKIKSHLKPLCGALYNDLFKVVVSACHGSVVNVWDVHTGEKVIMFKNAHEGHEITAMSFDSTKRRLITGSRNGTTKIWNFHNGACLRKLEPIDDGEITGILCSKQKILTVGWNRNVVEYSDLKGGEEIPPKLRSNFHKNDIMAADITSAGQVVTASYEGQVICWNLVSGYIYSSINVNRSVKKRAASAPNGSNLVGCNGDHSNTAPPQVHKRQVGAYSAPAEMAHKDLSVDEVFFLKNRAPGHEKAILLVSVGGVIQAWSLFGGLMGQFDAAPRSDESILAMTSNRLNDILLTGDSSGYIRIWDINNYCIGVSRHNCQSPHLSRETIVENTNDYSFETHSSKSFMTTSTMESKSLLDNICPPPACLRSYRGHCSCIVSIDYVENKQLIVTASTDCSVRLWTLDGQYVGTFGQTYQWTLGTIKNGHQYEIPCDLRRMASKHTIKVLNGTTPQWKLAKNGFPLLQHGKAQEVSIDELKNTEEDISELIELDVFDISLTNILGKNYKTKQRYKCPPTIKPKLKDEQCIAFSALPFSELAPISSPRKPSVLASSAKTRQQHLDEDEIEECKENIRQKTYRNIDSYSLKKKGNDIS